MRALRYLVCCALLCWPALGKAQNVTVGCGSLASTMDALGVFAPRFVSADSVYVDYRQRNGLRALVAGEQAEAVTDTQICTQLGSAVAEIIAANAAWRTAMWSSTYMRFGPYYGVYVEEQYPPDVIGSVWVIILFDVQTLARIPKKFECNC